MHRRKIVNLKARSDFLDDEMFLFDIENDVEDLLLENIVYQENGDEGNADEENVHYQDYCDEENEI